jgi:hypothetical protein
VDSDSDHAAVIAQRHRAPEHGSVPAESLNPADVTQGWVESTSRVQLQVERLCLAFTKREPRRQRLNPIEEFEVALLARFDEVHCVREILPGREPTYLEPSILIRSRGSDRA